MEIIFLKLSSNHRISKLKLGYLNLLNLLNYQSRQLYYNKVHTEFHSEEKEILIPTF